MCFHKYMKHPSLNTKEFEVYKVYMEKVVGNEELKKISVSDFVDAFGSIIHVRVNGGLNYVMLQMLKDADRDWYVDDIERLVDYCANAPSSLGNLSSVSYKSQSRLRNIKNWTKIVSFKTKMIDNFLQIEKKDHVKLTMMQPLILEMLTDT